MTSADGGRLRVALLIHSYSVGGSQPPAARHVRALARALRDAGHRPEVISSHRAPTQRTVEDGVPILRTRRLPEALLARRGFVVPLTQIPGDVLALTRGGFELAHAFSPQDALAALVWHRLVRRPVAFTCSEPLTRERLADRRLRLWLLQQAAERSDAVVAPTEAARQSLVRWLAVEARRLEPEDGLGHEHVYRALLGCDGGRSEGHG